MMSTHPPGRLARLLLGLLALAALAACRPRPAEGELGTFRATSPDGETGLYTLTAEEGALYPLSTVTVLNSNTEAQESHYSTSAGGFFAELQGSIGDVLTVHYSAPTGILSVSFLAVPLQGVAYHGAVSETAECLRFERDDADEGETLAFELVGDRAEEIRGDLAPGETFEGRVIGEPILLGVEGCDLPLLEVAQVQRDGGGGEPAGIHGFITTLEGEGEGGPCRAFAMTANLPYSVKSPPREDTPRGYLRAVNRDGADLFEELPDGRWFTLAGSGEPAVNQVTCALPTFTVDRVWADTGERRDLRGTFGNRPEIPCVQFRSDAGESYTITGPLQEVLRDLPPPDEEIPISAYPALLGEGAAPEILDACGPALVLAGLPGAPDGAPAPGEGGP